jgi:hypothetical protein
MHPLLDTVSTQGFARNGVPERVDAAVLKRKHSHHVNMTQSNPSF